MSETLKCLERIENRTPGWRLYIKLRSAEVQRHIDRLRRFASHRPGKVANSCKLRADSLQKRLDALL